MLCYMSELNIFNGKEEAPASHLIDALTLLTGLLIDFHLD
jgi:hypothetical protein